MNRLPLSPPPGMGERLVSYLTRNVAETRQDSQFPELRLRHYEKAPGEMYEFVAEAVDALGWEVLSRDRRSMTITAVVRSRIWGFKDDVVIRVLKSPNGSSIVYVRASSGIGKADLGANTRHVMDLYERLEMNMR